MKDIYIYFFSLLIQFSFLCLNSDKVNFDGRSFIVNSQRKLFIAGSFHYSRAPRSEWLEIFQMLRANGINLVQTYVFWDIHEPEQGVWNFPSDPDSNYGNYIISLHKKNMDIDFFPS